MRIGNNVSRVVVIAILVIVSISEALARPIQRDIERNRINAIESGDFSTNIIVSDHGELLLVIEGEETWKLLTSEVVAMIRRELPGLITEAKETIPEQSSNLIERLALANYYFDQGQYSLSASIYEDVINKFDLEDQGYNAVEGLTTASYFGSGRHVQGLYFICKQYKSRPYWSHRFRHGIHAHLRALTSKFGHDYAENVLNELRKKPECQREDFSKVWIPIHLHDMRNLEAGYTSAKYGFSTDEDRRYAARLIKEENHKFLDYLYFINGDYETIVKRYPDSYIYNIALLKSIENAGSYKQALPKLDLYASRYGTDSKEFKDTISYLYKLEVGRKNKVDLDLLLNNHGLLLLERGEDLGKPSRFKMTSQEILTIKAFSDALEYDYSSLLESLNIKSLVRSLKTYDKKFKSLYGYNYRVRTEDPTHYYYEFKSDCEEKDYGCFTTSKMRKFINYFSQVEDALGNLDEKYLYEFAQSLKRCGDVREFLDESKLSQEQKYFCDMLSEIFYSISYHDVASNVFEFVYDLDTDSNHKALFMAALCEKHNSHFDRFIAKLTRYIVDNPSKEYSDDALTEIGWYYLAIVEDFEKANRYFRQVVNQYKDTNAYDNALNWLVISSRNHGKYLEALNYGTQLTYSVLSSRIEKAISGRYEDIRYIAQYVNTEKAAISVGTTWMYGYNLFFGSDRSHAVVRSSSLNSPHTITKGAIILSVNGQDISDSDSFYKALINANNRGASTVELVFTRVGNEKLKGYRSTFPIKFFGFK